jgi:hypothetical protein
MLIIRSPRNAQRKRIRRPLIQSCIKADHVRQCDHDDVYVSIIERWALNVGRFTSAGNAERPTPNIERRILQPLGFNRCADQTLLPLHLSFCRTTLKNEASGNDASGSVFFALRMVTIDPRSTWIGLRPSSVRYTG